MLHYEVTHSVTSNHATPESIWAVWADVNNWPQWDKGLESCRLNDSFAAGSSFQLRPVGFPFKDANDCLSATITEVVGKSFFSDETKTPLGIVRVLHEIKKLHDGVMVTHTIKADILDEKKELFESTLLAKWKVMLPKSVEGVVGTAEKIIKGH